MSEKNIIERLRNCAEKRVFSVDLLTRAADRIEELEELVEDQNRVWSMFNNRRGRKRYIEYWRKKNGRNNLTYPDADEVYKEFWELKDGLDKTGHWVWNPDGNDWGIGAWECSECGCANNALGGKDTDVYWFACSHYCPQCGVRMVKTNENSK